MTPKTLKNMCASAARRACVPAVSDDGRYCRADVLSHGECCREFEAEAGYLHVEEHERDGHRGCGGLYEHSDEGSDEHEEDYGEESSVGQLCQHRGHHAADVKVVGRLLQIRQTHKEECESEDEFSDALAS